MDIKVFFLSWGMLVLSVITNAFGAFAIKLRLNELGPIEFNSFKGIFSYMISLLSSWLVIIGGVSFVISPFIFMVALSRMDISIAYPVQIVLNFILLLVFAVMFLGESLTVTKTIGIGLALISVILLQR